MDTKLIKKYRNKSIRSLIKIATRHFNAFIRNRDTDDNGYGRCISSGRWLKLSYNAHAGHYYPAGNYPQLRFNEDNVHLQSLADNYFKHGNLPEYRHNLIKKIGLKRMEKLDFLAKQRNFKWDKLSLIQIIEKYKSKL